MPDTVDDSAALEAALAAMRALDVIEEATSPLLRSAACRSRAALQAAVAGVLPGTPGR